MRPKNRWCAIVENLGKMVEQKMKIKQGLTCLRLTGLGMYVFFCDRSNYENQRLKSKMSDVFVIAWDQNETLRVIKHK